MRTGFSTRLILLGGSCCGLLAAGYRRPYFSNKTFAFSSEMPGRLVEASTGMMGSSVSSKSSIASSSSSTSSAFSCVAAVDGVGGAGATPASSTAGVGTRGCIVSVFGWAATGAALLEPLRVKTVLNLSRARPKLDRLPAALSAAGCCGESSCAPEDMVVIACQVLSFPSGSSSREGRGSCTVVVSLG